jgi:CBS domain-containing protein
MSTVQCILNHKGTEVFTVSPWTTVRDAARMMTDHRVGGLVVTRGCHIEGIVTERDVLRRVVAPGMDPATVVVRDVMTDEVVCCEPSTDIDAARSIMKQRRIRHLPVVDPDNQLLGLISIGDLNAWAIDEQKLALHYMQEYLYGSGV